MNKKHHRMPLLLLAAALAGSLCALGAVAISASAVSNTAFPTASRQNMNICLKQAGAKPSGQAAQPTGTPDTSPVPSSDPALQDPSQNGNPDGQPVRTPPCGCLQPCTAAQRNPECQLCAQDPAACQAGQVHIVLTGAYPAASSYTVTFDLNGHGGNAPANQVVEAGGHVAEPAAPTDADHNFYGWYRDADCTTKWDFAQDAVTAGLTLYAKWERAAIPAQILGASQHVTQPYGTKGGSISLEGLDIPAGHGVELQWYRNDRETTRGATLVATEPEGTLCYTIPADMPVGTYYYYCAVTAAREDNGEYARTYSDYFAVTIVNAKQAAPQAREGYAIDYREETVEIDDGYEIYTAKTGGIEISSGESISGYLGKAVYIRKAGMENYSPSDWTEFYIAPRRLAPPVSVQAETIQGKGDGAITGITEGMEYRRAGDADWTPGPAALTNLPAGTRVQVRFSATDETPHGKSKLCVIAAGTETFTVTFDGQGGDAQPHKITGLAYNATLSAPAVTRDGYTFTGWYKEAACTTPWNFDTDTVTGNLTLYAAWELDAPILYHGGNQSFTYNGGDLVFTAKPIHAAAGLNYTYQWYDAAGRALPGETGQSYTVLAAEAGEYRYFCSVTATDSQGRSSQTAGKVTVAATIEKAPVAFRVTDTRIPYDGQRHAAQVTAQALGAAFTDFTVSYRMNGRVVDPREAGCYQIVARINDPNYRHWDGEDGAAKQIGILQINPPQVASSSLAVAADGTFMQPVEEEAMVSLRPGACPAPVEGAGEKAAQGRQVPASPAEGPALATPQEDPAAAETGERELEETKTSKPFPSVTAAPGEPPSALLNAIGMLLGILLVIP